MTNPYPKNHPKINIKVGILLVNLGTPDAPSYFPVMRYLREFLSDRRVIELNPIIWQLILHCFILPFRSRSSAKKYAQIWMRDKDASPLLHYTASQAEKLQQKISHSDQDVEVDFAMRYGNPSIESKLDGLIQKGCQKLIVIPLYPQYCSATTATVCDEVYHCLKQYRWQPEVRIAGQYADHPMYIESLKTSIEEHVQSLDFQPDAILSSYHGMPKSAHEQGDPYACYCFKTHRLLSEVLAKSSLNLPHHISFQSRFGPKAWLQPYTADILEKLTKEGVKNLIMITPAFSSDCIETLEEVNMEYRALFNSLGGKNFSLVPCLNDSKESIALIYQLYLEHAWTF